MTDWPRARDVSSAEVADVHREIVERGITRPLVLGGADEARWADCDLASLAENRLGEVADPFALDDARRKDWRRRATIDDCSPPSERDSDACFWLCEAGERVGTVALASSLLGTTLLRLSSLYVFPSHRGRGVGARALARLFEVLEPRGLGLRLETSWTWQRAVRFYLRAGFWLQFWRHDLAFRWYPERPAPILHADGPRATLSVELGGQRVELMRAERLPVGLVLREGHVLHDERIRELAGDAESTFSLWLALDGWPLNRPGPGRERARQSDAGAPEGLAERIVVWEAWDRKHGWRIDAPRIPGLDYRSWDALRA